MEEQPPQTSKPEHDVDAAKERMERKMVRPLEIVVFDKDTKQPVAGAKISVQLFPVVGGTTAGDGRCRLDVDRFYLGKLLRLSISKEGYTELSQDFTFKLNQEVNLAIERRKKGFLARLFGR